MAESNDTALKRTFSRQNWIFSLSMVVCLFLAIFCMLSSVIWKHETDELLDVLGPDILRDIGIALFVSVFVTISIETYASRRLREHVAHDVLSAGYAKLIPDKIFTQINDNVFRSSVYRRNWEVHIHANADPERLRTRGTAVITARYSYAIENLKEQEIPYEVSASIDLDDPPPADGMPIFKRFDVFAIDDENRSDEDRRALVRKTDTKELMDKCPAQVEIRQTKGNLTLERVGQAMDLTANVNIEARRSVAVNFEVQREIRVPGNYVLSSSVPADGIKIIITVTGFRLTVVPLHPHRKGLRSIGFDTWQFDDGILPWQGFRFVSEIS